MLGRDVVRAAEAAGHDPLGRSRAELDVLDAPAVAEAMAEADAVVHCAAWTDVDGAEADEAAARRVNADGAGIVARAARHAGARLVHVSTDYVFDGLAVRPYLESDPVAPIGAYGRTKLAGEQAVREAGGDHAIARTAWLYGVGGRNFADTMLRFAEGRDEVAVVHDQIGCPTWTGHLARALVALAADRGAQGVFHTAARGRCSWAEFAEAIFDQARVSCRVRRVATAEFPRPAARPAWSVLGSERDGPRLPEWPEGLAAYLAERSAVRA